MADLDLDGDALIDILVGGDFRSPPTQESIVALLSNGDGTFRDGTAEVLNHAPVLWDVWSHTGIVGDFTGSGRDAIAVFDHGTTFEGCPFWGGDFCFVGLEPVLLVDNGQGKYDASDALADAVQQGHERLFSRSDRGMSIKSLSAGDIDHDGDLDLWVESCGANNLCSHFMVNNGDGTFVVSSDDRVRDIDLHNPSPEFWRHAANALVDLDNDADLDLVLGQARDDDPTHINQFSLVFLNDGTGRFPGHTRTFLPRPTFNDGFSTVDSMATMDVNDDGFMDLLLAHTGRKPPCDFGCRFIQVLINQQNGQFLDGSDFVMGDQSATSVDPATQGVYALRVVDINLDGYKDLVMGQSGSVGPSSPLVHLNDGSNQFQVMDPDVITNGDTFFAETALPGDTNGDGLVDFITMDLLPGPDGTYGTGDEETQVIALVASLPANVLTADDDGDGVDNLSDNCIAHPNPSQLDLDGDGEGNSCDADDDADGIMDVADNCALVANIPPTNTDGDTAGNACDDDDDNDGVNDDAEALAGLDPLHPDTDRDGIDDGLDTSPNVASNVCSASPSENVVFTDSISTNVTCAARGSISLQFPSSVENPGHLRLIAPLVVFDSGFHATSLSVLSQDPCTACPP